MSSDDKAIGSHELGVIQYLRIHTNKLLDRRHIVSYDEHPSGSCTSCDAYFAE